MAPYDEVDYALTKATLKRVAFDMDDDKGRVPKLEAALVAESKARRRDIRLTVFIASMGGAIIGNMGSGKISEMFGLLLKALLG